MRALAITGMVTASMMPLIMSGSLIRDTPPCARMSAGTRSNAMTATAPAPSAMRACSGVTTSMITPPLSISAMPRLTRAVPVWLLADPFDPAAPLIPRSLRSCPADSTAISSKSLLIQSKGGGKCVNSVRTRERNDISLAAVSANRLQLPPRHGTPGLGQRLRLLQKLTELQRIDGFTLRDQLGNHCRIAPAVAVNVGPLQPVAAGLLRLEPPGPVHEEHLLATYD